MPLVPLVQEISQERRGTIKARQAFGMDQPDLPQNEADVHAHPLRSVAGPVDPYQKPGGL